MTGASGWRIDCSCGKPLVSYIGALSHKADSSKVLGAAIVLAATTSSILLASQGLAAIAIVSAETLVDEVFWLTRMLAYLEQELNSVERLDEVINTPPEQTSGKSLEQTSKGQLPPAYWPSSESGLYFDNFSAKYAEDLPMVLQGVTFDVKPREKIGIVGRTGSVTLKMKADHRLHPIFIRSGKSTLAMSLLRFVEAASGSITLDGLDISELDHTTLRQRLTVMGQDAVLWKGTIVSTAVCLHSNAKAQISAALKLGPFEAI